MVKLPEARNPQRWWCRFGFHEWSMWSLVEVEVLNRGGGTFDATAQTRICERCGLRQTRRV